MERYRYPMLSIGLLEMGLICGRPIERTPRTAATR